MNIKQALLTIDKMKKDWYRPPIRYGIKRCEFEYQSYKHSAMNEIKFYLLEHQNENPISAIENFRYQMDCFACGTENGIANFMFSVYYDVATDVLDTLLGMNNDTGGAR